ncbi:MAG: 3-isopropylmalate dehydratase large subunit [Dolichospermum sp.]|jgi:3-isopropylmalate/(R)-2-methylmalate dehydratase large subunit|uniref:3-isopropylmalate dehydratase large subunit n=1 Tax=Dolichospermum circinale TaxID=109265 RepID=UPI0004268161|nr:3-isopropylmalate dehydratase large subunit [Dolichospermum circinale]MDB9454136.1 3-isopropylmalate dehydratase large subunit [Dolichospermum circinale CS-541/06]MDB9464660.1 3-isopropylmalate dehydratase large subunit [Dolichospermum circinale CS-541/04]MDB9476958.1 3-isopropylmalate dehydratase large subunit [Dolichospermum circinale CS-537/11]MDB9478113.1 3-isopropylmalate dehydratase large subunit [Dolichospermum circinale CS-537/03]MDB9491707.1 3-isopropylmalate dehydratase large subu
MSKGTLFDKVWDLHTVGTLPSGLTQLFIGLHLIHEVTSPQAFSMLKGRDLKVLFPQRTIATVDHIVPTENQARPFVDNMAEEMIQALEKNCQEHNIKFYNIGSGNQGIVHVIAPELGLTQPGMTIACGDSHTSSHGAFGAIAFGIGTSQVRDVLASQTLSLSKLKVRKIEVNGNLKPGVYAKDVILHIIRTLGVKGGVGYAYEFAGTTFAQMNMEERMTVCNMAIEGGARCGYVNPDKITYDYLQNRDFAPKGADWEKALNWWHSLSSNPDAEYDDIVVFNAEAIPPTVTWGITPGQGIGVDEKIPTAAELLEEDRLIAEEAYSYMDLYPGQPIQGTKIDVCFIGSCTNGRISDLREAAKIAQGRQVAAGVKAFVVPGSERVKKEAEAEGLDKIFVKAGFEWREPGCSMCLAMNPDKLQGRQISASSSNRNFKGRQGSSSGRTLLMSPAMVATAAIKGEIADVRALL